MSRYVIKEKFWSWGDDFQIYDSERMPVYCVDGHAFSWGDKLSFQAQKLIYRSGELLAEVIKEFSWFGKSFTLDVPGPNDYEIEGSFWKHAYQFSRKGRCVATVSKASWSWSDTYGIEVVDGEDDVAILCAAIVVDQVLHDDKKRD